MGCREGWGAREYREFKECCGVGKAPHTEPYRGTKGRNQPCTNEKLPPTKPNISWEEFEAIKGLKDDHSRVLLTADKG